MLTQLEVELKINWTLLSKSFCLLCTACRLIVVLTVALLTPDLASPLKVIVVLLSENSIWLESNGSNVPSLYAIEYLSASNGSKKALVNPIVLVLILSVPVALIVLSLTWWEIVRLESSNLTDATFGFDIISGFDIEEGTYFVERVNSTQFKLATGRANLYMLLSANLVGRWPPSYKLIPSVK